MDPEQAFLDQLAEQPDDDATRLVYADWLDERDDPRARYLRLEVELGQESPFLEMPEPLKPLTLLLKTLPDGWLPRAGKRFDLTLVGYHRDRKIPVIKVIRQLNHEWDIVPGSLKDAKHRSEVLPSCVFVGLSLDRLCQAVTHLSGLGGDVCLQVASTALARPCYDLLFPWNRNWPEEEQHIREVAAPLLGVASPEEVPLTPSVPLLVRCGLTGRKAVDFLKAHHRRERPYWWPTAIVRRSDLAPAALAGEGGERLQ